MKQMRWWWALLLVYLARGALNIRSASLDDASSTIGVARPLAPTPVPQSAPLFLAPLLIRRRSRMFGRRRILYGVAYIYVLR